MSLKLLAGPVIKEQINQLKSRVKNLRERGHIPKLGIFLLGNNSASEVYVGKKQQFAQDLNMLCDIIRFPENAPTEKTKLKILEKLQDSSYHGFLIQLPLPNQFKDVLSPYEIVPPLLDVDGLCHTNFGLLSHNLHQEKGYIPCTPKGILTLLNFYNIPITGKKITIIGRSHIVGLPLLLLLNNQNATVTLCHSHTRELEFHTKNADIIVIAIGKAKFLTRNYLSPNCNQVLIDVGMNRNEENKLCGDVDFENVQHIVSAITPVPGGVGPLTVLSLAENVIISCERIAFLKH